ncbi:MAG TPA: hypothetical protein VK151_09570 [Fluviicola sp.]|nr:hypothetical protein [Fluviicola sp.]
MRLLFIILGALFLIGAAVLYSFRESEDFAALGDFWWAPLPLSVGSIIIAARSRS